MNGPKNYYTKWSNSDKDKYHITCGIKKLYKWTYLQNRNRPRDIGKKKNNKNIWLPKWKGRGGINYKFDISKCRLPHIEWINNKVPLYNKLYSIFCNNLYEQNLKKKICVSESLCYAPETSQYCISSILTLGLQRDQTSQSLRKATLNIHWKDWCWSWSSNTWPPDVKSWLTGKDWCRERLSEKEGGGRGWDG